MTLGTFYNHHFIILHLSCPAVKCQNDWSYWPSRSISPAVDSLCARITSPGWLQMLLLTGQWVATHTLTLLSGIRWRFGKWLAVVWCKTCRLDGLKTLELDLRLHPSTPWGLCNGVVVSRPEEFADGLPNIRRRQPECLEFCLADRESMYCSTERPSCDALWEIMAECFWSFRRRMVTLVS